MHLPSIKQLNGFFLIFFLYSFSILSGQTDLSGRILDGETQAPLIGATVMVVGTANGAVTDADGNFLLNNLSEGEVTLEFSYIGYQTQTRKIKTRKNGNRVLEISMYPSTVTLEEVEVTGIMEGTIRAMVEQKEAENIKNVISAEQIATFPDLNAAEVMQRIPGITLQRDQGEGRYVQLRGTPPELTNFNVNGEQIPSPEGDVRYVGMDIIPADQIEFVEVTKVMTPDMDADGIGGSVNIKTKEAAGPDPEIRATLASGYNNLRQKPNYQLIFTYGQRYGKFGFNLNSSFYQNNQGADNLEYKYAKGPFFGSQDEGVDNYFVQYREVQLRHYDITRTRISVAPTLDFKFNENSEIYINGMYNIFSDDERRRRLIYDLDDALSETYYLFGGVEHDIKDRVKRQELATLSIGGKHKLWGMKVDYQLFYALAREREPDRMEARFESPGQAIAIDFDLSDPDYPRATFPNPNNADNVTDYENYELDQLFFEESDIRDINVTPRINMEFPLKFTQNSDGYFKFGGKLRYKDKKRDITAQDFGAFFETSAIYPGEAPPLSLVTIDDGFRENDLLGRGYALTHMPSSGMLRDFFDFYPQHFIFDRTATRTRTFGEDYSAKEEIWAGYAMFRQDFNGLMILGGFRYEHTNVDYEGRKILLDRGRFVGIDTLTDQRSHSFFLPQVQLKYAINDHTNIRAAWTYSYSRPNFEDVLPFREQERKEVTFGNPDLRYPQSTNVDLMIERYYKRSIFSGGLFYKRIDDFIFYFKRFAHEGDPKDYGLVEITKAINGLKASVYGAELQAQFKFDFLRGFLSDFGLYTNYTYTYSEAFINERLPANYSDAIVIFDDDDLSIFYDEDNEERISLPGQAEHTANFALFYDADRFFARLTANYQDAFLFQLGADSDLDEYYDEAFRLDFTANYKITRHFRIFTDLINLTNTPLRFYLGTEDRIKQQEFYSWWGRVGIKLAFD